MTGPVFPPMPAVRSTTPGDRPLGSPGLLIAGATGLSVLSRVAAAEQFGVGSQLHAIASRLDPPPPPTPEEQAELDRIRAEAVARVDRWTEHVHLCEAFGILGECLSIVEAHARALADIAWSPCHERSCWYVAFSTLALLFERSPELLPIGPAVHADCHGEDW